MSIFIQYQDLHIPIIPEVMIEFDTVDADDEGSLLSRSTSLESKNNVVISTTTGSITTAAKEAIQKKGKVIRDSEELSLVDKEEFAYPTNLTSSEIDVSHLNDGGVEQGGLWSDRSIKKIESTLDSEKDSSHHNDDELLTVQRNGHSRANNPSSGSDLIQVTVEDLLISEEQNRTIRANTLRQLNGQKKNEINKVHPEHSEHLGEVDHAYEHKSVVKMSPSPTMTTTANSSNSSNSTSSVTMTTITATIRTTSDKARSILFDEDIALEVHSDSEEEKRQQRTQGEENVEEIKNKKPQQPQKGAGSQMRGKDSSKNAFQPLAPKALTPAQQREVEADENIQKAIELHENNQLEEATRYFALAAQSENPLGQLMYGLSLRHGWGCKSNPAEAIKYLQRAAEYAMGELNELNPITPSPQISTGIPIASTSTTPQELSVDEKRQSSSALSDRYSENDSNDSAKPRASQQTLRRMGSMDRKEAIAMARRELVMALYELGMSYLKGWGVNKDKKVAFTYFKIAADLVRSH
ncbi:hypothetical protein BX616_005661 [Lobosporangium transversale]|nr:hypothetical protein BX616_005661 [Lobosporangium transversale]